MAGLGTFYSIGGTLTIPFLCKAATGAAVDVDSNGVPTYQVFEAGGTTAIAGLPAAVKRDDIHTTGYYEAVVTLTAALGFEDGKSYTVLKSALINGVTVVAFDTFAITNAGATAFTSLSGWPTLADVQARFDDMGLTAPADDTITAVINACVTGWGRASGYVPFLADSSDTTWRYEPNGTNLLDFGQDDGPGGFVSVTSVVVDSLYGNLTGQTLVERRDFILKPANAANKSEPLTYCVFKWFQFDTGESSIVIVGKAGYATVVPADVWEAVMRCVLKLLLPLSDLALSGGLVDWHEADVGETYIARGSSPMSQARDYFEKDEAVTLALYRRLRVMGA